MDIISQIEAARAGMMDACMHEDTKRLESLHMRHINLICGVADFYEDVYGKELTDDLVWATSNECRSIITFAGSSLLTKSPAIKLLRGDGDHHLMCNAPLMVTQLKCWSTSFWLPYCLVCTSAS
jgi:hypothetical protein